MRITYQGRTYLVRNESEIYELVFALRALDVLAA
jgi:hypothetical protein